MQHFMIILCVKLASMISWQCKNSKFNLELYFQEENQFPQKAQNEQNELFGKNILCQGKSKIIW